MKNILLIVMGLVLLAPWTRGVQALEVEPTAVEIASVAGLEHWGRVASIEFTFNVKLPDRELARSWRWEPLMERVTFAPGTAEEVVYVRSAVTEELKKVDADFINDTYWLLFPFQLVWSDPVVTESAQRVSSPINGQWLREVRARWDGGGYTPGDTYVLYVDDADVIREWVFERPGSAGRAATWEGYVDLGGLQIATDHRNADGSFRLFFSGLRVVTATGEVFEQ